MLSALPLLLSLSLSRRNERSSPVRCLTKTSPPWTRAASTDSFQHGAWKQKAGWKCKEGLGRPERTVRLLTEQCCQCLDR